MSGSIFDRLRRQIGPRMSDEHDFEDQSHTPDQGATEQRDLGADAMSELARLISLPDALPPVPGRTDEVHKPEGRLADVSRGAPALTAATRDSVIRNPAREPASLQGRPLDDRRYGDDGQSYEDRSSEDRFRHQPFEGRSSLERGARRDPDFAPPRMPVQPVRADTHNPDRLRAADDFDFLRLPAGDDYAVAPRHGEDYDHGDHSQRHPAYGRQHAEYVDEYHEDRYEHDDSHEYATHHDDPDDGAPGVKRRRGTTKVVMVVLGLTIFGSAAAVGYRAIFKGAPSGPAPFIRADNSPTKVVPAAVADANAKPANGLPSGSREQVVRRDEDPVDVSRSYRTAAGDAGTPGSPSETAPMAAYPAAAGQAGDPRRVRTVPIRVDQGAASSDRAASRAVPAPQSQASPPPQPQAPVPPRQAAASPPPNYAPPPAAGPRVANVAPAALAPEAAPSRAIEAGGGFVVQVSAQRSEAEAQAAFRALQTKYPILNGRDLFIRRKDLGERGIFFAAQVGPFGVKGDADQLCETLKAAGGACFVQKN